MTIFLEVLRIFLKTQPKVSSLCLSLQTVLLCKQYFLLSSLSPASFHPFWYLFWVCTSHSFLSLFRWFVSENCLYQCFCSYIHIPRYCVPFYWVISDKISHQRCHRVTCSGSAASYWLLAYHYSNGFYELVWGDVRGSKSISATQHYNENKTQTNKNITANQLRDSARQFYPSWLHIKCLIFRFRGWTHVRNDPSGLSSVNRHLSNSLPFLAFSALGEREFHSDTLCLSTSFQFSSYYVLWKAVSNKFLFTFTIPLLILYNYTLLLVSCHPADLESPVQAAWKPSPPSSCLVSLLFLRLFFFPAMGIGYVSCGCAWCC